MEFADDICERMAGTLHPIQLTMYLWELDLSDESLAGIVATSVDASFPGVTIACEDTTLPSNPDGDADDSSASSSMNYMAGLHEETTSVDGGEKFGSELVDELAAMKGLNGLEEA